MSASSSPACGANPPTRRCPSCAQPRPEWPQTEPLSLSPVSGLGGTDSGGRGQQGVWPKASKSWEGGQGRQTWSELLQNERDSRGLKANSPGQLNGEGPVGFILLTGPTSRGAGVGARGTAGLRQAHTATREELKGRDTGLGEAGSHQAARSRTPQTLSTAGLSLPEWPLPAQDPSCPQSSDHSCGLSWPQSALGG